MLPVQHVRPVEVGSHLYLILLSREKGQVDAHSPSQYLHLHSHRRRLDTLGKW